MLASRGEGLYRKREVTFITHAFTPARSGSIAKTALPAFKFVDGTFQQMVSGGATGLEERNGNGHEEAS